MRLFAPWLLSGPDWSGLDVFLIRLAVFLCSSLVLVGVTVALGLVVFRSRAWRHGAAAIGALGILALGASMVANAKEHLEISPVRSWGDPGDVRSRCPDVAIPSPVVYRAPSDWRAVHDGLPGVEGDMVWLEAASPLVRWATYVGNDSERVVLRVEAGPDLGPHPPVTGARVLAPGTAVISTGEGVAALGPDGATVLFDGGLREVARVARPSTVHEVSTPFEGRPPGELSDIVSDGRGGALVLSVWQPESGRGRARIDHVALPGVASWAPVEWDWPAASRAHIVRRDGRICAFDVYRGESVVVNTDGGISLEGGTWAEILEDPFTPRSGWFLIGLFAVGSISLIGIVWWLGLRSRWIRALARGEPLEGLARFEAGAAALVLEDGTDVRLDLSGARHRDPVEGGANVVVLGGSEEVIGAYRDSARERFRVLGLFAGTLDQVRARLEQRRGQLDSLAVYAAWFGVVAPWLVLVFSLRLS